jgi:hypothetical protein
MAQSPTSDLEPRFPEARIQPEEAAPGTPAADHNGADLSFWRDSAWAGPRPAIPSQTAVLGIIVAAVVVTVALLVGGGLGSPGFSLGLAIGVGVAGFPCLLMFIADFVSLRSTDRRSNPSRTPREEDWERFWAPRGASRGPEGSAGWTFAGGESSGPQHPTEPVDPLAGVRWAYDLLGLPVDAGREEVRSRYHRLAHQFHPDKAGNQPEQLRRDAEKHMKELNAAYELLRAR